MVSVDHSRIVLHANQEHASVRFLVLVILLVVFVIAFFVLNGLLTGMTGSLIAEFSLALSCVGGLIVGISFAGLGEYIMKRTWPSGFYVSLDDRGVEANLPDGERLALEWSKRFWMLKWHYSLKGYPRGGRERRVSSRTTCVACQLQQDEVRFIIFAYLPMERAKKIVDDADFHEIKPGEYYERGRFGMRFRTPDRPQVPTSVLTGREGPYWMAEKRRWTEGLELTSKDFEQFLSVVNQHNED